jgi:uncharacterized protein
MTPQERQLIDELFDRLSNLENAPRDPDAIAAISQGLRRAPNALYPLVQTVLVQDEALKRADSRIQELEQALAGQSQRESGGFLDSMRERFGQGSQPRGSVPNVPPPAAEHRPVWNSGQAMQQVQPQPGSYGQGYGAPAAPFGGGGSFLGTAAAAAAGVVGGSLLLNGIRSMMGGGGSHYGYADTAAANQGAGSPWSDQSNTSLAHDLGADDIGRSGQADHARAGAFDQASNDGYDNDQDDMDTDSDDYGSGDDGGDDGGSDYA